MADLNSPITINEVIQRTNEVTQKTNALEANTLRSLNSTQATQIVTDGTYNGVAVENGEVFTNDAGKFQEFSKTANQSYSFLQKAFSYADFPCASSDKFFNFRKSGSPTTVQVSSDGVNWTDKTLTQSMSNVNSGFVEGNEKLIMLQPRASKQYTSTDGGNTWSYSSPSLPSGSDNLTDGHYIPGFYIFAQFYLNSLNGFIYSTDGSTWTQGSLPDNASNYGCFASDGTYFYYLERDHGDLYKTSDCVNWSLVGTSSVVPDAFTVLKHYQGKFWTYQYNYSNNTSIFYSLKYSSDGLTWSSVGTISHPNTSYSYTQQFKLGYCGSSSSGVFVIAYFDIESTAYAPSKAFYISSDGVNWTENNEGGYRYSSKFISNSISGMICGTNSSVRVDAVTTYSYALTDLSMTSSEVNSQGFLKNTATGTGSITIGGTSTAAIAGVNIGNSASISSSATNSIAIGNTASSTAVRGIAIGSFSTTGQSRCIGIGCEATASGAQSIAIGDCANTSANSLNAVCIGYESDSTAEQAIGVGGYAQATASYAIQLGRGTNSTANTLSVGLDSSHNYQLLNSSGQVPTDRYIAMTGADGTNAGTTGAVPAPAATDNTKFLRGDGTWAEAGGTVDQTFDGTSANAQSGVAINGAGFLKNNTSNANSLAVLGSQSNVNDSQFTVLGASAKTGHASTAVGYYARALGTTGSVAVGNSAYASSGKSLAVGDYAQSTSSYSVAVGANSLSSGTNTTAIGGGGTGANVHGAEATGNYSTAIGYGANTSGQYSLGIGARASSTTTGSIQLGYGTNNTAGTLAVALTTDGSTFNNYELLSADGTIPAARLTNALTNTATGTNAISVGYSISGTSYPTQAPADGSIAVGTNACVASAANYGIAIGGNNSTTSATRVDSSDGIALGRSAKAYSTGSISIGGFAEASGNRTVAIGYSAKVASSSVNAIQIGTGTNSTANTLCVGFNQIGNYELLSADGTIPKERLANALSKTSVTLAAASWSGGSQTVTVSGMTATAVVFVSPAPASASEYASAGVMCTAQAADSLTFTCGATPTSDLTVNVIFN